MISPVSLRLLSAFAALAAGAAAVVFVLSLLHSLPPVATSATSSTLARASSPVTPVPARTVFPAPPRGAVVFGGAAGPDALGLSVVPGKTTLGLQAALIDQNGDGIRGLRVGFDVRSAAGTTTVAATPCGKGCYRASAHVARPQAITVSVGSRRVAFAMPATWPPPSAAQLVAQATAVYTGLRSFVIHDEFGDGHATLHTVYWIVAPDELVYQVQGGGDAVIIGDRRWDRPEGSTRWLASAQTPITQPTPFWQQAVDAHLLGTVSVGGRPAWKVSFFDPTTPGWFTLLIDKATLHTMEMRMVAHAHFMHDTYSSFDKPIRIKPPSG